jgi:hypothetical protein
LSVLRIKASDYPFVSSNFPFKYRLHKNVAETMRNI